MAKRSGIDSFVEHANAAYKKIFANFARLAAMESVTINTPFPSGCFIARKSAEHPNSVEIEGALRLDRVPHSRKVDSAQVRRISVLLDSFEIFKFEGTPKRDNGFLYNSNVRIGYYGMVPKTLDWETLLAIHYDFKDAKGGHPIFHAQLDTGLLTRHAAAVFKAPPAIVEIPVKHIHTGVRVPTANVIGPTALLNIASDHLAPNSFKELLKMVQVESFFRNWSCNCTSLDDPASVKGLISSGWYGSK